MAADNNYVKNGSFEADRRYVPTHVKPDQIYLSGWETTVIKGNKVSLDSNTSPVLNYFNSETDRKIVIGEKSLHISDKINFKRKVSQTITSSPYVKLGDGYYTMTAKIKNSSGFDQIEIYAISNGKKKMYSIKIENKTWTTISIKGVLIKGEKVEIGFLAEGISDAHCYVDDVTLVKEKR